MTKIDTENPYIKYAVNDRCSTSKFQQTRKLVIQPSLEGNTA
jgi:hypothetical protein